jgi:MoaA/NifB/PqqE/SkfB family radical SAM enzyme
MDPATRALYDSQRNFRQKSFRSACYAPFTSLYFTSLGDVLACCKSESYSLGNVARERLGEIWNGKKLQDLRDGLKAYEFGGACEFCEAQFASKSFENVFAAWFDEYPVGSERPEWPQVIEFAGSNNCNFECIMCDGLLSSSIRAHREGLPPLPRVYSDQFFEDLRPFLPHLRCAKFLGGEPFLAQECFRIWDMIMEAGLEIPCHVTTNASQYNAKVERVINALPVSFTVSMDGATKETMEKIRVNCDFDEFMRNVHRFREYARQRGTWFGFAHCLMRPNWHEFGDVLQFAEKLGCSVFVNTVLTPRHSLYTLPAEELNRIVDEMELQGKTFKDKLHINREVWEKQLEVLRASAKEQQLAGLTQIKTAVRIAEGTSSSRYSIDEAWALVRGGRFDEALADAQALDPSHPVYYQSLILCAHIYREKEDLEQAEEFLTRALQLSRKPVDALIERAWLRLTQKRTAEGIADALQAAKLCHENELPETAACRVLGHLYAQAGDADKCVKELDRLLELTPNAAEIRVHRAWLFWELGLYEKSALETAAALDTDPNYSGAVDLRTFLLNETASGVDPAICYPIRPTEAPTQGN